LTEKALNLEGLFLHSFSRVRKKGLIIKKTLGITLALLIGSCVVLITIVLVLQVILSLLAAE
jgi:hypothetical protein